MSAVINPIEWRVSTVPVAYGEALDFMHRRAEAIRLGTASECVWLLEHPPLFTAGTSADPAELSNPLELPVFDAGRGGRFTYHGPGQRVGYVMLDLARRGHDVRRFVCALEAWLIDALARLGVDAHRSPAGIGIWVGEGAGEAKIAAIGVRVRRWVTLHGFSVNVAPDLAHYGGIIPCGIADRGVTSLARLGCTVDMVDLDRALRLGLDSFLDSLEPTAIVT